MALKLGSDTVDALYLGADSMGLTLGPDVVVPPSDGGGGGGGSVLTLNGAALQLNGDDLTLGI